MNETCLFCKIINGSESALVIYKDDDVIAFFPRVMNVRGHLIVAPILHSSDLFNIPNIVVESLMVKIKLLARHCQKELGSVGVNLLHASGEGAQQSIPHFHFHLLPRFNDDDLDAWPDLPTWDGDHIALHGQLKVTDILAHNPRST